MNIGNRIKDLRKKLNLTQLELADKCGLSKNAIWNYENNKRKPQINVLSSIAAALGVPLSFLIEKQDTLTSKLINVLEKDFGTDAENTLELICELIDIDDEVIDNALKNNEDISESYLSKMIEQIYKDKPDLFVEFFNKNKQYINNNYPICFDTCMSIVNENTILDNIDKLKNTSFEEMKNTVDNQFPTLEPMIQLLSNPKIEMIYNFTYNELAAHGYEELLFTAIEKTIKNTLQDIKDHENNGDIFDGISAWITKESPLYEILKQNQANNQIKYTIATQDDNFDKKNKKKITYDNFETVAAHNDNLTNAEIEEADRRILEDINKKNTPST